MTVLFCDLIGSTELSQRLDPEDLLEVLSAFSELVRRIAARFGGHVARVVGDGVDVYFGYPWAGEDDAVRAVHAGLAIIEQCAGLEQSAGIVTSVQVRVGIATGLVAIGARDALTIAGGVPNLAARIQTHAAPGQVVIAPSTRRIAGAQFAYRDLGDVVLKGFGEPVRLSAVVDHAGIGSRSAWRGHDTHLPLVGRQDELDELMEGWRRAVATRAVTGMLVVAEPGLGKSRLASEVDRLLAGASHITLRLQCSPFHANSALQPIVQHLADSAGLVAADSPAARLDKLRAQLAIAGLQGDEDVGLIGSLMGIAGDDSLSPADLPPAARLQLTLDALGRYVLGLGLGRASAPPPNREPLPLLLIVEDMHWMDPTSLELVARILGRTDAATPVLVLMTSRSAPAVALPGAPTVVSLPRLSAQASRAMASQVASRMAAEAPLPLAAIETIIQRTDGVPLYVEEMTRMVMDVPQALAGQADIHHEIPDTLRDLLTERLDGLGLGKWLAQVASVIGHAFDRRLLQAVADLAPGPFDDALDAMQAAGLILAQDPRGERFVFKHALIEDAAYESITQKEKSALHDRVARALLRDAPEAIEREPELAAHHLSKAHRPLEAADHFLRAGAKALSRGAPREAAAHLSAGVAVLSDVPPSQPRKESELALLSMLGPTTMVLKGPGSREFRDVQRRAYWLCHDLPGSPRQFPITYGLCLYHWGRAELSTALGLANELLQVADARADDAEAEMAAHTMAGMVKLSLGEPAAAKAHLARSVARHDPQRDAALYAVYLMNFGVFGRFYLALATLITGEDEAAEAHAQQAYDLAGRLNEPHTLGFSMVARFTIAMLRDQPGVARRQAEECLAFAEPMGFLEFTGFARVVRGWATAREGRPAEGLADMEAGIALWQQTGFENWQCWFACLQADVLMQLGRPAEALLALDIHLKRIERTGEQIFRSLMLARKAMLLHAMAGPLPEVQALWAEASDTARAQRALAWTREIERRRAAMAEGG